MTLSFTAARDALSRGLFADTATPEKPRGHFGLDMLSDWLPYRVYDEGAKLYRNARSKRYVIEVVSHGATRKGGLALREMTHRRRHRLRRGDCRGILL